MMWALCLWDIALWARQDETRQLDRTANPFLFWSESMKRQAFLFAAALLAVGPALSHAEDASVVAGAIDPYDAGAERARFLAAAGVDSELSEEEFKASAAASEPFARKFDSWSTLKSFDRNGNGTIDWFEADGYRKALRDAVMLAYDKDKSGKLNDGELETANKDLAAGKVPRVSTPRRERPGTDGGDQPSTPGTPGATPGTPGTPGQPGGDRGNRGGPTEEQRAEFLKKYDKDGNGELSDEERSAGRTAQIEEWRKANPEAAVRFDERRAEEEKRRADFTKKYDKDGNGELSDEERREGFRAEGEARLEAWKERDPEAYARFQKAREDFTKKYDKDGNGELSDEERRAGFDAAREEGRKKFEELSKKYDKDGDGQLSREEREELFRNERDNLRGFFPGGDRGGRGGDRGGNQPSTLPQRGNNEL